MHPTCDPIDDLTTQSPLVEIMQCCLPLYFAEKPSYRTLFEELPQTASDLEIAQISDGEAQLNTLQDLYRSLKDPRPAGLIPEHIITSPEEAATDLVSHALANHETHAPITLLMEMLINVPTTNLHKSTRAKVFKVRGIAREAMNDLIPVSPDILEQLPSLEENVALRTAAESLLDRSHPSEHLHTPLRRLIELGGDLARPVIIEALRINPCRRFQAEMLIMIVDPKEKLEIAREVYKRSQDMRSRDLNWNSLLEAVEKPARV